MTRTTLAALLAAAAVLTGCGGSASGDGEVPAAPDPCEAFRPQIQRVEITLGDVFTQKPGAVAAATAALTELKAATVGSSVVMPALIDDFVLKGKRYATAMGVDPAEGYSGTAGQEYRSAAGKLSNACMPVYEIPGI